MPVDLEVLLPEEEYRQFEDHQKRAVLLKTSRKIQAYDTIGIGISELGILRTPWIFAEITDITRDVPGLLPGWAILSIREYGRERGL